MAIRRKGRLSKGALYFLIGFLLFALFGTMGFLYRQHRNISHLRFLNHFTEAQQNVFSPDEEYDLLKQRIKKEMADFSGSFAVYLEDLSTGHQFGINSNMAFPAASVIKVPLVLFLYSLALDGRINLDETISIVPSDLEPSPGGLWSYNIGTTYTLRQLAKHTIEDSDNTAANMLMRRLGRTNFYLFLRLSGASVIPWGPGKGNVTCARDAALYLKGIWLFRQIEHPLGEEMMQYLLHSKFDDRIPAGVPFDVEVANKIGSQEGVFNDTAIIFLPNRPYVLSVLCCHPDEQQAVEAIGRIARLTYEYQREYHPRTN
ncbi:hypothetical protein GJ688_17525 [Heliobacillus mobilis]|uniref:Beta-lactamase class A catalytic domain-containing protein n=1 Tax=Heliobacterium mobile TaxID=28064 RepID=A0A6I3SPW5_HELMO|nr:serine hydrolase [Heliobacterium mobile]MTV50735.1 hypothetical protein [Heliobacterium mobile]